MLVLKKIGPVKVKNGLFQDRLSMNWRGQPLTTYQTIVDLIASTTTKAGLKVQARVVEKGVLFQNKEKLIGYHKFVFQ